MERRRGGGLVTDPMGNRSKVLTGVNVLEEECMFNPCLHSRSVRCHISGDMKVNRLVIIYYLCYVL